jgi:LysM repeat protein
VDRICPYLALADDGRTVADGFDPEHRCHALTPPAPLERARQVQLCLTEAHARCERFAAARTAWLAASSGLPRVAPDVAFGRTRLILEPEPAWRNLASPPAARLSRRVLLIGAAGAAVVLLLLLGNALGILGGSAASASPTPSPSPTATATATPVPSQTAPQPSPSVVATASPTPVPTASPTPAPTPHTYIVQQGDTLNAIAARFGTTAQAIAAANGISVSDTLDVGQVLVIP